MGHVRSAPYAVVAACCGMGASSISGTACEKTYELMEVWSPLKKQAQSRSSPMVRLLSV
jgi:hypothetical protein